MTVMLKKITTAIRYQSSPEALIQDTLCLKEGLTTSTGALAIRTGEFTGRSPQDKFIVRDELTENTVHWNSFNIPIDEKCFRVIYRKILDHLNAKTQVWVRDGYARADPLSRRREEVDRVK